MTCPWCGAGRLRVSQWAGVLSCEACNAGTIEEHAPLRVACLVPGCTHQRGDRKGDKLEPGYEWVCADHWRLVPRLQRAVYSRAKRRWRRRMDQPSAAVCTRLWARVRAIAIETAMGVR